MSHKTTKKSLLIELGCEELPPKSLKKLSDAFSQGLVGQLKKAGFEINDYESFCTPRRLAVLIKNVAIAQNNREVERKGPSLKAAYNKDGLATKAATGFAKSCGVELDKLDTYKTENGEWLYFKVTEKGKFLAELIENIVQQSLLKLPVSKKMRWANSAIEFVRPPHWLVILHGSEILNANVLALTAGGKTYGHRFHAPAAITLKEADDYQQTLQNKGYVIASFEKRRQKIQQQVIESVKAIDAEAIIDEQLLDEVCSLNEWPIAVLGEFEKDFLQIPSEVLIKTMQDNQKYFPVKQENKSEHIQLKNYFVTISNINSKSPEKVKQGNERVVRPRLSDAMFFWQQDLQKGLELFNVALEKVVFQSKLGTIAEKTKRVGKLAENLASQLKVDKSLVQRAIVLSKADLMSAMVTEFPALQGVMGKRYAQEAGEHESVALAIDEQYMPRTANDEIASSIIGQILSISDKIDTLVGIFAIGLKPSGEKDPYALRRASLGVLRTMIEASLDIDLKKLISSAANLFDEKLKAKQKETEIFDYIAERLRSYYLDKKISANVIDAVFALSPTRPLDFDKRIKGVDAFNKLPEAKSLAAANKRVANILKKYEHKNHGEVSKDLLKEPAEKKLYQILWQLSQEVTPLFDDGDYQSALTSLSQLREPVDAFFDNVMVMVDDESLKNNRMALLNKMNQLFLRAADLSRLHQV